ncbi:MAG: C13 family peptidase, partial [Gammaproteobacteria bacterium]
GIRWRIVLISACYSGSFIPYLQNAETIVATAARADRKALGCSEDRELTYFGEALFRDALPESDDLLSALERARELVTAHERAEEVADGERSEPELFIGARMREKLAELKLRPAS